MIYKKNFDSFQNILFLCNLKVSTMQKTVNIDSVSEIRFGLYAQPERFGSTAYVQVRQFNDDGRLIAEPDEFINIDKKAESHLLMEGDVLFVGKGNRLFSWCYHQTEQPAVASSIFFVLKPDLNVVIPDYLAAILNAGPSKAAFRKIGAGTNIFSIRKSELAAFQIPLPSMQQQKRVAALDRLHQKEVELAQQLISQKQNLYTAIISKLIK
jgi:restriction endonuclease S subunit